SSVSLMVRVRRRTRSSSADTHGNTTKTIRKAAVQSLVQDIDIQKRHRNTTTGETIPRMRSASLSAEAVNGLECGDSPPKLGGVPARTAKREPNRAKP